MYSYIVTHDFCIFFLAGQCEAAQFLISSKSQSQVTRFSQVRVFSEESLLTTDGAMVVGCSTVLSALISICTGIHIMAAFFKGWSFWEATVCVYRTKGRHVVREEKSSANNDHHKRTRDKWWMKSQTTPPPRPSPAPIFRCEETVKSNALPLIQFVSPSEQSVSAVQASHHWN